MAANSKVQIGLSFTADTSKARQEIDKLKNDLSKIVSTAGVGKVNTSQFNTAISQAAQLRGILEESTKATGKLDLSKFERGIRAANIDLSKMATEFKKIDGGAFFNNLAQQVMAADTRVTLLSGTLKKFAQGLMNTAMWTIQSNAIHAVQSALSNAYSYAQKLNKGLTDIAIVSDLNTKQLTEFARTANKMAKELSASTSDYVSGALIYYQAGLTDEEVIERTNTTIKLAQTSGETAESISSYMTAIWNNFYDGSKSVEYYADAISYLGAVTAASNADIAEGMQAFSAVANTVGLSFEYGASALTLLRDITQQSASTIGNSLKTIFARLSSVAQGDTLEDGVDLTKYTKALNTVGVSVLDVNGDLREMDDILDDLGARWDTLNNAQKVALAQTVGGVRQYNNLISLMDNYEKFQELVQEASGSDGYLQHQADIYAESWEGAKNRLTTAWQGIYDQLIDDKFFIKLTDFITKIVNTLSKIIDGVGGLPGVLSLIGMAITSINPEGFAKTLRDVRDNILLIKDAISGAQELKNIAQQTELLNIAMNQGIYSDNSTIFAFYEKEKEYIQEVTRLRAAGYTEEAATMAAKLDRYNNILQTLTNTSNEYTRLVGIIEEAGAAANISDEALHDAAISADQIYLSLSAISTIKTKGDVQNFLDGLQRLSGQDFNGDNPLVQQLRTLLDTSKGLRGRAWTKALEQTFTEIKADVQKHIADIQKIIDDGFANGGSKESIDKLFEKFKLNPDATINQLSAAYANLTTQENGATEAQKKFLDSIIDMAGEQHEYERLVEAVKQLRAELDKPREPTIDWATNVQQLSRMLTSVLSLSNAIDGLFNSIKKGDLTGIISSIAAIGMAINSLSKLTILQNGYDLISIAIKKKLNTATKEQIAANTALQASLGPVGVALAVIAAIAMVVIGVFTALSKAHQKQIEQQREVADTALQLEKEQQDLIDSTQELSGKVRDLAESYQKLKNAGKDAFDVSEDLKENIPELIDLYGKLGLNTRDLWAAYQLFINGSGSTDAIVSALDKLNIEASRLERTSANNGLNAAAQKMSLAEDSRGKLNGINYSATFNGMNTANEETKANSILTNTFKQADRGRWLSDAGTVGQMGTTVSVNMANPREIVEYYELLEQARAEMVKTMTADEINKSGIFEEINQEVNALSDTYKTAKEQYDLLLGTNLDLFNQEGFTNGAFSDISKLSDLESNSSDMAAAYAAQYETTFEEARQALENSDAYKELYKTLHFLEDSTTVLDAAGEKDIAASEARLQIIKDWYDNLPEEDKTLVYGIDFGIENFNEESLDAQLQELKQKALIASDEAKGEEINKNSVEVHKLEKEAVESLTETLKDEDVTIKGLSKDVKNNATESAELADDILRFGRAATTAREKMDDWNEALKSRNTEDLAVAFSEMRDAYSDLLDIDGTKLTSNFLDSKDNLELMKKAINGSEEAYQQLLDKANADLTQALGLDPAKVQAVKNELQEIAGTPWEDIEIGAIIDDSQAIQAMENLINSAQMTAEEATDYLASMGVDAVVEEQPTTTVDNKEYVGAIADVTPVEFTGTNPLTGRETRYRFPSVTYKPDLVPASETNTTTATTLKVTSARKSSGGNFKYKHSSGGSGSKSKPSGGGGGSKKQTKEPTRYHEINSKIEQNTHKITMNEKDKENAYGAKRIEYIETELELLQKQADLYKELENEAKNYLEQDKQRLESIYGAKFNEDGSIANFDEWYKKFMDKYNSGNMTDDEWKKFEDAISKYEDSLKHLNDAQEKYQDTLTKIFDGRLEKIEYKLKTVNELIEKDIDYLDYMIKQLDKSMYDTADVVALIGKKLEDVAQQANNERNAISDILTNHLNENFTAQDLEDFMNGQGNIEDIINEIGNLTDKEIQELMKHQSALIKYNETLIELREQAYEKLGEAIDEFNDKIERQKDIVNDLDGVMRHYRNIIDIVGKDTLGISDEMLRQMSALSVTSAKASLQISRDQLTQNQEALEKLYARREELLAAGREADVALIDKEIEAQEDRVRELTEAWASAWEDALKAAEEAFKNSVKLATDAFSQAMSSTIGNLDDLQEAMEMQNTLNDRYLPTYQKIYELNKLTRDVNNAIDNTNNIAGKERLLKLQEDILKKQQDGEELTEYELGMFQRRLELTQAEIALEEAQNAKSMVRMTRDSEGNWSYTYTADAEAVDKAQQNYEDKLYNLKKYNQDSMKEFESAMWQAVNEYKNSIADLDLTDEERAERIRKFQEQWVEHNKDMFQMTLEDAQWILDTYGGIDDLINTFAETVSGQTTDYTDLTDFFATFGNASATMMNEVTTSYKDWYEQYHDIFEKAGTSVDDFANKVEEDMKSIEEAMIGEDGEGGAVGAARELGEQMEEQTDNILEELRKWFEGENGGYSGMIDSIIENNEKLYGSIQALITAYADLGDVSNFAGDNSDIQVGDTDTGTGTGGMPTGLASGGYTGRWGPGGKLAVLHEKELVLNERDTENMLTAIGFVRDLTQMIALNAAQAGAGLGSLFSAGVNQGGGFLDQTVTIHAEFPNATNHSEIEEAFSNLIGLASQYAGRKK